MNIENIKIAKAYESIVNEKFKNDIIGAAPHVKTIAILTAENPFAVSFSSSVNRERNGKLESVLSKWRIPYRKVIGHYGDVEHSYELINVSLDDAKRIAAMFNQQSFVFAVRREVPSGHRGTAMTYKFYAYRSKVYDLKKAQFERDNEGLADGEKTFPEFDSSDYIEVDSKDSLDYHATDVENDDFYTRKNSYKFSVPFDYFDDRHMTEIDEMLSDSVKRHGDEMFDKMTMESIDDKCTPKRRWENRVMLSGHAK